MAASLCATRVDIPVDWSRLALRRPSILVQHQVDVTLLKHQRRRGSGNSCWPGIGRRALETCSSLANATSKTVRALFGLKYPIFEAPMGTSRELPITVSNAATVEREDRALAQIFQRECIRPETPVSLNDAKTSGGRLRGAI
jgi:hypothetical protein